jgi:uncharacterized protein YndB with AHSA1/START domain
MTPHPHTLSVEPVAATGMLIRKPAAEVFEAFVNPAITTQVWFTKSSGRLTPSARITWTWEMYNISTPVLVREIEQDKRIVIEWGVATPTTVEWTFTPHGDATMVDIVNRGFAGSADERVRAALDSLGGFTWVLAGMKAFLEHGVRLNLVADRYPNGYN